MFIRIKKAVMQFSKRPEVLLKLQEQQVKLKWEQIIKTVNPRAAGKTEAIGINQNKELVIRVANHLWLQEMRFYKNNLDKKILQDYKDIISLKFIA